MRDLPPPEPKKPYVSPERLRSRRRLRAMMRTYPQADLAALRALADEMAQRTEYRDELIAKAEARLAAGTVRPENVLWLRREIARLRATDRPPFEINPSPAEIARIATRGRFVYDPARGGAYYRDDPDGDLSGNAVELLRHYRLTDDEIERLTRPGYLPTAADIEALHLERRSGETARQP